MKRLFLAFFLVLALQAAASDSTRLYNPYANAEKDVTEAVAKAKKQNKYVLLQIGGNWCSWCYKLNSFIQLDPALKALVENNFIVYHLNYSPENKNLPFMKKLGFPQRFGFPVLVVLDMNGNRVHTQDSSLLEKGNGYDAEKVKDFLINWSPGALNENLYKD